MYETVVPLELFKSCGQYSTSSLKLSNGSEVEHDNIARDQCFINPTVIHVDKESKLISDITQSNSDQSTCSYSYNIDSGKIQLL